MKRIRIGNDLTVLWAINNRDGSPYNLQDKEVRVFALNYRRREEIKIQLQTLPDGEVNNVIRWDFRGKDQKVLGPYTITVEIITSEDKKVIKKDIFEAFELISNSCDEGIEYDEPVMEGGELMLSSQLDVFRFGVPKIEIRENGNWFIDGVDTGVSATSSPEGTSIDVYAEDRFGDTFDRTSTTETFNAAAINALYEAIQTYEPGSDMLAQLKDVSLADPQNGDVLVFEDNKWKNKILAEDPNPPVTTPEYWEEIDDTIHTYHDVYIHGNLIVGGDTASEGEGANTQSGINEEQLQDYLDKNNYVTEEDVKDLIPEVKLDELATKAEVDSAIASIDLSPYATKVEVNNAIESIDLSPYAKAEDVAKTYATKQEVKAIEDTIVEYQPWLESLKPLIEEKDGDVHIKTNIIIDGDTASSGEGVDVQVGINQEQLQQYLDDHNYVTEDDIENLIPEYDLTQYATKHEVDEKIAGLINGAPTTLDTLGEIATAFAESENIIQALDQAIGQKANQSELDSLSTLVSSLQTTLNSINAWYSKLTSLLVEENGNVRVKTNLIIDGDVASE